MLPAVRRWSCLIRGGDGQAIEGLIDEIYHCHGVTTVVARRLGVSIRTVTNWRRDVPGVELAVRRARNGHTRRS